MSKVAKNIKMLDVLSSGKKYTCKELSNIIEVSPREIRNYKEELEKNGIYIDSYYGKDGGYKLRSKLELPTILFNEYDLNKLDEFIENNKTNKLIKDIINIRNKVFEFCKMVNNEELDLSPEKNSIYSDIKEAILTKKDICIEYFSKGELKNRVIKPMQIYSYNNNIMIVVQYSEDKNDIRHLNLNRIEKIIK